MVWVIDGLNFILFFGVYGFSLVFGGIKVKGGRLRRESIRIWYLDLFLFWVFKVLV